MAKLEYGSIQMDKGDIFDGKRIGELVESIINKFSEEGLTCDEAKIVLEKTKDIIGEYSVVMSNE